MLLCVFWWKFTEVSEVLAASIFALMIEAAGTYEKAVKFSENTHSNIPQDN
jgi:hypothetical protein